MKGAVVAIIILASWQYYTSIYTLRSELIIHVIILNALSSRSMKYCRDLFLRALLAGIVVYWLQHHSKGFNTGESGPTVTPSPCNRCCTCTRCCRCYSTSGVVGTGTGTSRIAASRGARCSRRIWDCSCSCRRALRRSSCMPASRSSCTPDCTLRKSILFKI